MTCSGFPHSDILGSQLGCQLPEAYRRLLRPSSAPCAQASTVRPLKLRQHTKTLNLQNCLQDARVHYAVLKKQPHTTTPTPLVQEAAGRTSHTPPAPQQDQAAHAASQPNSVSPPQTRTTTAIHSPQGSTSHSSTKRSAHSLMFHP